MNLLFKFERYFQTLRYLKPKQVFGRVQFALTPNKKLKKFNYNGRVSKNFTLPAYPQEKHIFALKKDTITIRLLNREKNFQSRIDWSFNEYGRLWNYNLQYADFLRQEDLTVSIREEFVLDLFNWLYSGKLRQEPYPASLRIMNITRFLCENFEFVQKKEALLDGLYSELYFLSKNLEYHLLANHLLENGFALLMGGTYLNEETWIKLGKNILEEQLNEQILNDGAHFERSMMYHQLILFRILETIRYLDEESDLRKNLKELAPKMLSWSKAMTFSDNSAAHFNDSVGENTYLTPHLISLANAIDVNTDLQLQLSDSGFRKFSSIGAELIMDVESIKPEYQPGHAHADSLSFIMHLNGKPFIVDPAVSTYHTGERRNWERATQAHNTITVNEENSADVWSSFRVGRRPVVKILNESKKCLTAEALYQTNTGIKVGHKRTISFGNSNISITDDVNCRGQATGRFYFAPERVIKKITDTTIEFSDGTLLVFSKNTGLKKFDYKYSRGFNKRIESFGIEYRFEDTCVIDFKIL